MIEQMNFYICNGKKPECSGSTVCRRKGGCFHTTDSFYALYDTHDDWELIYHEHGEPPEFWERIRTAKKR